MILRFFLSNIYRAQVVLSHWLARHYRSEAERIVRSVIDGLRRTAGSDEHGSIDSGSSTVRYRGATILGAMHDAKSERISVLYYTEQGTVPRLVTLPVMEFVFGVTPLAPTDKKTDDVLHTAGYDALGEERFGRISVALVGTPLVSVQVKEFDPITPEERAIKKTDPAIAEDLAESKRRANAKEPPQ